MADHDRGPEYAVVECIKCSTTAQVPDSRTLTTTELIRRFEALGWSIKPTLCPQCQGHSCSKDETE